MTLRIGWFSPISTKTGIASYTAQVLEQIRERHAADGVEVVVFHPEFTGERVAMPYPTVTLSDTLLESDFNALFDVAVYHLGNNSLHHGPIYQALMRHPGIVVLHDHVYQHYLAGISLHGDHVGSAYVTLAQNADPGSFRVLSSSGVMRCDRGDVHFVPWESEWATRVPLADRFAALGLGAVVHSDYAASGLRAAAAPDTVLELFMPAPALETRPKPPSGSLPIRIACCGHIGSTKGLTELVNAFVRAPHLHHAFHVTIAGFGSDPTFLGSLRRTIQEARLGAVFDIRVDPSDDEYGEVMTGCDLFYNLRYPNTEGASLSLMEQLAHGRPVMVYRTGSFAEVPEEACYFLDEIGDTTALIALLDTIAADPSALREKGRAAQAAVAEKTASAYADAFVAHLRAHMDTYRRRMALSGMRAAGGLAAFGTEAPWMTAFLRARREMQDFYADRLMVPTGFTAMSAEMKGDFVASVYLDARVDARNADRIGRIFEGLSPVALTGMLGQLLVLASISNDHRMIDKRLRGTVLPITDPRVWRILSLLPTRLAAYYASHALGLPITEEQQARLSDRIGQIGFRAALRQVIADEGTDSGWRRHILDGPLEDFFNRIVVEDIERMPALVPGDHVLELLRREEIPHALLRGFHPIEEIGIWASATEALILFNAGHAAPLTRLSGKLALLGKARDAGQTVTLRIEEMATGREIIHELRFTDDLRNMWPWSVALPDFTGAVRMQIRVEALFSPSDDGKSGDTRQLGPLLQSLFLGPPPEEAAQAVADVVAENVAEENAAGEDPDAEDAFAPLPEHNAELLSMLPADDVETDMPAGTDPTPKGD